MKGGVVMGLDMYVYKFEKISENDVAHLLGRHTKDISEVYTYFDKEDFDSDADMYSDLIPYITQIEMVQTRFDDKRCFADYGFSEGDIIGSHCGMGEIGWYLRDNRHIILSESEYNAYLYEANLDVYVIKGSMIAYWRKAYELHDHMEDVRINSRTLDFISEYQKTPNDDDVKSWMTENCGYYELSERERKELLCWMEKHPDDEQDDEFIKLLHDNNNHLFYHAWW